MSAVGHLRSLSSENYYLSLTILDEVSGMAKPPTAEDYWLPTEKADLSGNIQTTVEIEGSGAHCTAVEIQDQRITIVDTLPIEWYADPTNRIGYSIFSLPYKISQPWSQETLSDFTTTLCAGTLEFQTLLIRDNGTAIGPKMEIQRRDGSFIIVAVLADEHLASHSSLRKFSTAVAYGCSLQSGRLLGQHLISCIQTFSAAVPTEDGLPQRTLLKTEHEQTHSISRVPGKEHFVFTPESLIEIISAIDEADNELKARVRTSLSWVSDGRTESARNQFLRIWFAIDTLLLSENGNKKFTNQLADAFASVYRVSSTEAKERFYFGKIEGIRDAIVHHGFSPKLNSTFVDYCYCIYCDFIMSKLDLPEKRHTKRALENNEQGITGIIETNMEKLRSLRRS